MAFCQRIGRSRIAVLASAVLWAVAVSLRWLERAAQTRCVRGSNPCTATIHPAKSGEELFHYGSLPTLSEFQKICPRPAGRPARPNQNRKPARPVESRGETNVRGNGHRKDRPRVGRTGRSQLSRIDHDRLEAARSIGDPPLPACAGGGHHTRGTFM